MDMEKKLVSKPKKGVIICRVSSAEQARKGTSLESQKTWGINKAIELNVEIIKIIKEDISGVRFAKDNYEYILNLVEVHNITHVFVHSFDRLSRSLPHGVMLIQSLWDSSIQIVTSTFMPHSDNSNDRFQVWLSLLFAEMEHGSIYERTRRGITTKLKSGIYPLPWLPFGYERIDLKISLKSEYRLVIKFIFEIFIEVECYNETAKRVNEKYGQKMGFVLKGRDIRKIVQDKIYLGYLSWGGLVFGEGDENESRKELKAIDEKTFATAQVAVKQISHRYSRTGSSPVEKLVEEYGIEATVNACNLKMPCPKCGLIEMQKNGKENTGDMVQLKYICKKCNHHFRFPSGGQLKRIENLISAPCRNCGLKDHFVLEKNQDSFWKLICKKCSHVINLYEYLDRTHGESRDDNEKKDVSKRLENKKKQEGSRNFVNLDSFEVLSE